MNLGCTCPVYQPPDMQLGTTHQGTHHSALIIHHHHSTTIPTKTMNITPLEPEIAYNIMDETVTNVSKH